MFWKVIAGGLYKVSKQARWAMASVQALLCAEPQHRAFLPGSSQPGTVIHITGNNLLSSAEPRQPLQTKSELGSCHARGKCGMYDLRAFVKTHRNSDVAPCVLKAGICRSDFGTGLW